jgi:hypothetical protein
MGSIHHEISLDLDAASAWAALRRVDLAHRLFAGVLVDSHFENGVRTVAFAGGQVVRERIIDIDDERRRIAYSAFDGTPLTHHNASMQIVADNGRCRFVCGDSMLPLIREGTRAMKSNLESGAFGSTLDEGESHGGGPLHR